MVKYSKKRCFVKKIIFFLLVFSSLIYAKEYYAKVEPLEILTIASQVKGEVLKADENLLGKKLLNKPYIIIDDALDQSDLRSVKQKVLSLKKMIQVDENILLNLQKSMQRKEQNYKSIQKLSVKSKIQKDTIYFDLIATKNQLLNTQKELENYRLQLADLQYKKAVLQKSIKDKTLLSKGMVLYELLVKKGQFVNPATPLAKVADVSKAVLTIYVDAKELEGIMRKKVFIDQKETPYKVSRISYIADSVNISKYKVQIIIDPPKIFSKLLKVELK